MMNKLHGIVFAYRSDPDLRELTQNRNTSSLPYCARYRLVDFMLSNMVNAGVQDVGLIAQSSYQSLLDHVGSGKDWDLSRKHGGLRILPPFSYAGHGSDGGYRGRMDALAGVRSYLQNIRQEHVVMAWGDMAVTLPLSEIYDAHKESGADITVVCTPNYQSISKRTDYFTVDEKGWVTDVAVSPEKPQGMESLELYILSKTLLLSLVDHCAAHNLPSFSQSVLLGMLDRLQIKTYVYEGYAARMQSVGLYFQSSMALLKEEVRNQLFLAQLPVRTKDRSDPSTYYGPEAKSVNSLIADGCIIEGEVENSILFRGVKVEKGAKVSNCILFQGTTVQRGAVLNSAITDKNVTINQGRMLMGHSTYPLTIAKNETI